jgi:hypothetical protein
MFEGSLRSHDGAHDGGVVAVGERPEGGEEGNCEVVGVGTGTDGHGGVIYVESIRKEFG